MLTGTLELLKTHQKYSCSIMIRVSFSPSLCRHSHLTSSYNKKKCFNGVASPSRDDDYKKHPQSRSWCLPSSKAPPVSAAERLVRLEILLFRNRMVEFAKWNCWSNGEKKKNLNREKFAQFPSAPCRPWHPLPPSSPTSPPRKAKAPVTSRGKEPTL